MFGGFGEVSDDEEWWQGTEEETWTENQISRPFVIFYAARYLVTGQNTSGTKNPKKNNATQK